MIARNIRRLDKLFAKISNTTTTLRIPVPDSISERHSLPVVLVVLAAVVVVLLMDEDEASNDVVTFLHCRQSERVGVSSCT